MFSNEAAIINKFSETIWKSEENNFYYHKWSFIFFKYNFGEKHLC